MCIKFLEKKLGLEKNQFKFEEKKFTLNHLITLSLLHQGLILPPLMIRHPVKVFHSVVKLFNVSFSLQFQQCYSVTTNENSVNSVNSVKSV